MESAGKKIENEECSLSVLRQRKGGHEGYVQLMPLKRSLKAWDQGADAYLGKEWVGSTEV